jgi:hypothetical protein
VFNGMVALCSLLFPSVLFSTVSSVVWMLHDQLRVVFQVLADSR